MTLSHDYRQMAQGLRSSTPSTCRWLNPEDIKLIGRHPIAAGGFANIWEAKHDGRKVVLKSYRCYMSFDAAQVAERFRNEVHVCNLLHHIGEGTVPFVGVYSTEAHPFGLVYEYMDGLDLRQYLKNEPTVGKLKLLTEVAQCLNRLNNLGIIHRGLHTANILVDKDGVPRIAGLGNVHILPHSTAWTTGKKIGIGRFSSNFALGPAGPRLSPNATGTAHAAESSYMRAFGFMTFEVLAGHPPFSRSAEIATGLVLRGDKPIRPDHREISDTLWHMVERCWHNVPSQHIPIREAVNVLETEFGRAPNSQVSARA